MSIDTSSTATTSPSSSSSNTLVRPSSRRLTSRSSRPDSSRSRSTTSASGSRTESLTVGPPVFDSLSSPCPQFRRPLFRVWELSCAERYHYPRHLSHDPRHPFRDPRHPFSPPVSPTTMYRWKKNTTSADGIVATTAAAAIEAHWIEVSPTNRNVDTGIVIEFRSVLTVNANRNSRHE